MTSALLVATVGILCVGVVTWHRWRDLHGLRVLVWHRIDLTRADRLTVTTEMLIKQLRWIRRNRYSVIAVSEIVRRHILKLPLPRRAIALTFDDGCISFLREAVPVLQANGMAAMALVPVQAIMNEPASTTDNREHMCLSDLNSMPTSIEIGLHSYAHTNYAEMTAGAIVDDIACSAALAVRLQQPLIPVFAYPFGAVPRTAFALAAMKSAFGELGITLGLRLGGGINRWPLRDPYRVRRIGVRGTDSLLTFQLKMRLGRVRL